MAVATLVVVVITVCGARLLGWWPCSVACAGGAAYEKIVGIPALVFAEIVYGIIGVVIWRDIRRGAWSTFLTTILWVTLGIHVFYASLLLRLEMPCFQCWFVHGTFAVIVLCVGVTSLRWSACILAMVFGTLSANALFHHRIIRDDVDPASLQAPAFIAPASSSLQTERDSLRRTIEANRSLGSPVAPWRVDVIIDSYCSHCADHYAEVMKALTPLSGAQLSVITRHLLRASEPLGAELARYILAAAACDRMSYVALEAHLLGTRSSLGWADVRLGTTDIVDLNQLESMERRHRSELMAIIADDAFLIRGQDIGSRTPALVLVDVTGQHVMRRWNNVSDMAQITVEIKSLIRR